MKLKNGWEVVDIGCGWMIYDPQGEKFEVAEDKEAAIKKANEEAEARS